MARARDNIPLELKARRQWVLWRFVKNRNGRIQKVPYAIDGECASSADPSTWSSLDDVLRRYDALKDQWRLSYDGIGFMFDAEDPYTGVDLDDCRDPHTEAIAPWARAIIDYLNSYTEISPSKTGVKVFVRAVLPDQRRHKSGGIEVYDRKRYFTVTGHHLDGTPLTIEDRVTEVGKLYDWVFPAGKQSKTPIVKPNPNLEIGDAEILTLAFAAKNEHGPRFQRLWEGNISGYATPSEADLALCSMLAFWTGGDEERIDALFRQSALMRDKWDEVHRGSGETYGEMTTARAIQNTAFYHGREDGPCECSRWCRHRNRRSAPKGTPNDGSVRMFSELAADALRRKDVPWFILWSAAQTLDSQGEGRVRVTDLINFLSGVYTRSYFYRLLKDDRMKTYFGWFKHGGYVHEVPNIPNSKWKCFVCRRKDCRCRELDRGEYGGLSSTNYLYYKSPARLGKLGFSVEVPLKKLEGTKDRNAVLFEAFLAPITFPVSQTSLAKRTGVATRTQREWRERRYFRAAHQFAEKEITGEVNPALLKTRGAVHRGGKLTFQMANIYLTDFLTAPPSHWLRRRLREVSPANVGVGGVADKTLSSNDGGGGAKEGPGFVYFTGTNLPTTTRRKN